MEQKLMIVKVTLSYFVQWFEKGTSEPYRAHKETYFIKKAFDKYNCTYSQIIDRCRAQIASTLPLKTKDADQNGYGFEVEITYDYPKLIKY